MGASVTGRRRGHPPALVRRTQQPVCLSRCALMRFGRIALIASPPPSGKGIINYPPRAVMDVAIDVENRTQWDDMVEGGEILQVSL